MFIMKEKDTLQPSKKYEEPVRDIEKRNHEFSYSLIHKFELLHKCQGAFMAFIMVYYFLFITLRNIVGLAFSFYRL